MTFLLVASADHVTAVTGASPTVTISKNGGAFASPSGAVTEIGSGWYQLAGNATDRGTLGEFLLHATAASADPADKSYLIVPWDPFDAADLGLTNLDAAISSRGTADPGDAMTLTAAYDAAKTAAQAGDSMALTSAAVDAVLDEVVEGALTFRQMLRLFLASLAGKAAGGGTGSVTFRDAGDTKPRITMTVDGDGNRTAVSLDAS